MNFDRLEIERDRWGSDKGKLSGSITFSNDIGRMDLKLSQEHINRIFQVVAETMIEVASEAAKELTVNIIEHDEKLKLGSE